MSILDKESIDGIAYDNERKAIIMLITDHLGWENEYEHLIKMQDKINNYICYCENRQYLQIYKNEIITNAVIDIRFLMEPSKKAFEFLQVVQNQVGHLGIRIQCTILGDTNG
jgi:hypothetical protein